MNRPPGPASGQRGVALAVALMMVLITTLLGLTAMRVGVVETRTIANEEVDRTAFHAAEAAALEVYDTLDPGTLPALGVVNVPAVGIDPRFDTNVTVRREGRVPLANSSLRLFARVAYAIESTATSTELGARRTVVTGASQLVPSAP